MESGASMEFYVKNKLSRSASRTSSRRNSVDCKESLNEVHEIMRSVTSRGVPQSIYSSRCPFIEGIRFRFKCTLDQISTEMH